MTTEEKVHNSVPVFGVVDTCITGEGGKAALAYHTHNSSYIRQVIVVPRPWQAQCRRGGERREVDDNAIVVACYRTSRVQSLLDQ